MVNRKPDACSELTDTKNGQKNRKELQQRIKNTGQSNNQKTSEHRNIKLSKTPDDQTITNPKQSHNQNH